MKRMNIVVFTYWCYLSCIFFISDIVHGKETSFTGIIHSDNPFCASPKVNNINVKKIICDLNHTNSRLGDLTSFMGTADWRGGDLYIEIKNCMNLSITSAFHAWRINFSSLYLIIENAENVIQEEVPSELSHVGRDSLLFRSDFISFSLKRSKMDRILPSLISNTKALVIDIVESRIGTISEDSFQNVFTLWQFRLVKSNITRIANRAMPETVSISPSPAGVHVEWTPFIFNETNIEILDSDALNLRISEKDDYFNIINSRVGVIRKGGLSISGTGHVVVADSVFHQIRNDSIVIRLKRSESGNVQKLMDFPTLTLMGVEIFSVDVTNFLFNLQVTDGKLYLFRLAFLFPEGLSSIISLDNQTISGVWDLNHQITFMERWSVICNCHEISASLISTDSTNQKSRGEFEEGIISKAISDMKNDTYDYEDFKQSEALLQTPSSLNIKIWNELGCYQNSSKPIGLQDFHFNCLSLNTGDEKELNGSMEIEMETPFPNSRYPPLLTWYLVGAGSCVLTAALITSSIWVYKTQKRKTFNIGQRKNVHRPNKQVGVISEDPICGCEGEDESSL